MSYKFKELYAYAKTDDNNVNLDKSEKDEKKDETIIPGVYRGYKPSGSAADALNAYNNHLANKPSTQYATRAYDTQLNTIMNDILNRKPFEYDLNGDALYQQYKDKFIQQGKMAMGDAIGQAQAMTGGYGNSFAQSVGQQAYQGELNNLNDIIPELYQMAYDKDRQEVQDLYSQYALVDSQRQNAYDRSRDRIADWQNELSVLANNAANEREFDYDMYSKDVALALSQAGGEEVTITPFVPDANVDTGDVNGARSYLLKNGVPGTELSRYDILDKVTWGKNKALVEKYGKPGSDETDYNSYEDYLADVTRYILENYYYGQGKDIIYR
ncbi:MAG: hypothetical protein IKB47_00745 [Clostridia bacterium]|nr:hypothetical protein [Clostridia bacterium]